jgi:hypothetical protein
MVCHGVTVKVGPEHSMNLADRYDVVVVGGGTAGVMAALQAARAGAATLLVEKNGILGGTTTVAGVAYPGLFHAWGRQIIAGIGWELVRRCVAEAGGTLPDFAKPARSHPEHQVRLNPALYACLCDEALVAAGAGLRFHTMAAAAVPDGAGWRLTLCTKSGLCELRAAVLIDGTGDADLCALAGAALRTPAVAQPGTLRVRATGYEVERLDFAALEEAFAAALGRGEVKPQDATWDVAHPRLAGWLRQAGGGANHIGASAAHTSAGRTDMELAGRQALLRMVRFLRRQPGMEHLSLDTLAPECGVRETATIIGDVMISEADYVSGRLWPDAVCYSFYPIDLHLDGGSGLDCRPLAEGVVPTVPRGALLPQGTRNLLAAGRCLSSDRLANSALRVQATCMATGQAAGALAALAARGGSEVRDVPLVEVHGLLRQHGAIVPPLAG